ncbi:MAG: aldehyde dehydrogenase family protein, partial [Chlorobiales bacterium]|nr:aldehyde dehydrogenase family protein [Chlorobiales bacterium]
VSGRTKSYEWRRGQLLALKQFILDREAEITDALYNDFRKSAAETWFSETGLVLGEIVYALKHLKKWMKPRKVPTPLLYQVGKSYIQPEPVGVVLIIAPWNYPFQLCISPLVGALAAGNCAIVKPSELAPNTSKVIAKGLEEYLDRDAVRVVEGGVVETTMLLNERFDYIFFTGGTRVGQIVHEAATKHLTPVTLELGGKSPCIVHHDAALDVAASRIVWAKFLNGGQTCVAPDYLLVHESVENELIDQIKSAITKFYGENPKASDLYPRMIDNRHFNRLVNYLNDGEIIAGGETDEKERYIAPTILRNVSLDSPIMNEEIFGPILPVLTYSDVTDALSFINSRPKPLALYIFTESKILQEKVVRETQSGSACINELVLNYVIPGLPFGGTGQSGMGAYHGRASFDTFSHRKSIHKKATFIDPSIRYPPYSEAKLKLMKWIMKLTW